ncbi:glycosyltransferase family 4 protein [Salisaeta longa]|uniref:glycosyltransferase family 4 protein n=1 Tax=Salisaeta longa TaxID=503170 RepID=UPI00146BC7D1|nr:glycosyltransferase family 4 protein [Salisaeta longa]
MYPPAGGATGAVLAQLAPALVARGWRVTVLTGPADAPASETTADRVRVERVGAARFTRASTLRRAWAYLSLYPAFVARALRLPRPDVLVTKTDPPMLKVLGPLLGRATGAARVHWAQDLYPEVAEQVGVIAPGGGLANVMRRLSTAALRRHDRIVAVGRCMRKRMLARGLAPSRISVCPNPPPDGVRPVPHRDNSFRAAHASGDRFVVMYSGNMGLAHPFDAVLDAAARLQSTAPEVLFLLVGDGPRKDDLQQDVARRGLANVQFLPFQPLDRLSESLSAADVHVVTMETALTGLVVPSKLYGVLAAGRPALFLGPDASEAARTIREHEVGTVCPAATADALVQAIRYWKDHPSARAAAGERAAAYAEQQRHRFPDTFDTVLRAAIDARS